MRRLRWGEDELPVFSGQEMPGGIGPDHRRDSICASTLTLSRLWGTTFHGAVFRSTVASARQDRHSPALSRRKALERGRRMWLGPSITPIPLAKAMSLSSMAEISAMTKASHICHHAPIPIFVFVLWSPPSMHASRQLGESHAGHLPVCCGPICTDRINQLIYKWIPPKHAAFLDLSSTSSYRKTLLENSVNSFPTVLRLKPIDGATRGDRKALVSRLALAERIVAADRDRD